MGPPQLLYNDLSQLCREIRGWHVCTTRELVHSMSRVFESSIMLTPAGSVNNSHHLARLPDRLSPPRYSPYDGAYVSQMYLAGRCFDRVSLVADVIFAGSHDDFCRAQEWSVVPVVTLADSIDDFCPFQEWLLSEYTDIISDRYNEENGWMTRMDGWWERIDDENGEMKRMERWQERMDDENGWMERMNTFKFKRMDSPDGWWEIYGWWE